MPLPLKAPRDKSVNLKLFVDFVIEVVLCVLCLPSPFRCENVRTKYPLFLEAFSEGNSGAVITAKTIRPSQISFDFDFFFSLRDESRRLTVTSFIR